MKDQVEDIRAFAQDMLDFGRLGSGEAGNALVIRDLANRMLAHLKDAQDG